MSIQTPEDLTKPEVELSGTDGNAFAVIGTVARALREVGNSASTVDAFRTEAFSGDYDHVLQTAMAYADVS